MKPAREYRHYCGRSLDEQLRYDSREIRNQKLLQLLANAVTIVGLLGFLISILAWGFSHA